MTPDLTITISPEAAALAKRFGDRPGLMQALARGLDFQNELTVSHIQSQKLTGQVLHVVTGLLRRSIRRSKAIVTGSGITSSIGSNVKYAAIHEFGGVTKPHVIVAKGKPLAFSVGGKTVFAKKVNHPGSKIPERSYIRTAIADRAPEYGNELSKAIVNFYSGGQTA